MDTFYTLVQY